MNKPERVAFRLEFDPYMKVDKVLACFPDEETNPGRLACLSMWFDGNGNVWFEPWGDCVITYYWECKPLKDVDLAQKCKEALETRYDCKLRIVKRIMWR